MVRLAYSLLLYLLIPVVLLRLLWRARKAPAYLQRWGERFGFFRAPQARQTIWVHAVSVGETQAAAPLVRRLMAQHSRHTIVLTTTTPTGSEQVKSMLMNEIEAGRVLHFYAPYDLPDCVERFLRRTKPQLLIIMETELWLPVFSGTMQSLLLPTHSMERARRPISWKPLLYSPTVFPSSA